MLGILKLALRLGNGRIFKLESLEILNRFHYFIFETIFLKKEKTISENLITFF